MKANRSPLTLNSSRIAAGVAAFMLLVALSVVFIFKDKDPDNEVFNLLSGHITNQRTRIMIGISFLGNYLFLIPANLLLLTYFIIKKNKWTAFRVGLTALSSLGMMSLLKNLVRRERPSFPLVGGITNFSFPSGHAFMSVAFFGLLIAWTAESVKNKRDRRLIIFFLVLLIAVIGFSRIYLRLHYTTDVVAGWSAGTLWLVFSAYLLTHIQIKSTGAKD